MGKDITCIATHLNNMTINITRGITKVEERRGTCHLWDQGLPTWDFVVKSLGLQITGIWFQVKDVRGFCTRIFPGLKIYGPLNMNWYQGKHKHFLIIDRALIPSITHKFGGGLRDLFLLEFNPRAIYMGAPCP